MRIPDQPAPTPSDSIASHDFVIHDVLEASAEPASLEEIYQNILKTLLQVRMLMSPFGVNSAAALDLIERKKLGIERYGTPLQPDNGRDSLVDLYQELLDAAAYAKNKMREKTQLT